MKPNKIWNKYICPAIEFVVYAVAGLAVAAMFYLAIVLLLVM